MVPAAKTNIRNERPARKLLVTMAVSAPIIFLVVMFLS